MRAFIRIFVCVLLAAATAQAFARVPITEEAIETSADMLSMPASSDGTLVIARCTRCTPTTLQASAATEYAIGKQKVTLQDFAAFVRSNPRAPIGVMYDTSTRRVIRLQA